MGMMQHHAIVVTSWSEEAIKRTHEIAKKRFPWVSEISPPATNGYTSFFIPPDGSKDGWPESAEGDAQRKSFLSAIKKAKEVGWVDCVEVDWGDMDSKARRLRQTEE